MNRRYNIHHPKQEPDGNSGSNWTDIVDQEPLLVDDANLCSTPPIDASPIVRQFWKAGVYNDELTTKSATKSGSGHLHVHPRFLHSNATSHKWIFGAIAELIDNAVDEIQNNATFVSIDKTSNPRNGSLALLIQDDGSGMDPEGMRHCLSFGFSDKTSISSIGKYGNGFKTSSMRLGADVIVFSRSVTNSTATQSIGLLSYTFLTQGGYDRIVVPMVHYNYNFTTSSYEPLQSKSDNSNLNLSTLLQWSPYSTEAELLKQFETVGYHGTKIIVYNLWLDGEGKLELDFESDPADICIEWDGKSKAKDDSLKAITENHIANHLQHSLRAYLSILYLKLPSNFCISLRGKVVIYYNIAADLKDPEYIMYKPVDGGCVEGTVITTIGFLKEAPDVNIHGFNIYHKGRLILPFLRVVNVKNSRGRGVVGVLDAHFIEPTHNKQDFEKTNVFQKLVTRLKEMTMEYWDCHCGQIGYQVPKKFQPRIASPCPSGFAQPPAPAKYSAVVDCSKGAPLITTVSCRADLMAKTESVKLAPCRPHGFGEGSKLKRELHDQPDYSQAKKHMTLAGIADTGSNMPPDDAHGQKKRKLLQQNKMLQQQCLEFKKAEEELKLKVKQLKTELEEGERVYNLLLAELWLLEKGNRETNRHIHV